MSRCIGYLPFYFAWPPLVVALDACVANTNIECGGSRYCRTRMQTAALGSDRSTSSSCGSGARHHVASSLYHVEQRTMQGGPCPWMARRWAAPLVFATSLVALFCLVGRIVCKHIAIISFMLPSTHDYASVSLRYHVHDPYVQVVEPSSEPMVAPYGLRCVCPDPPHDGSSCRRVCISLDAPTAVPMASEALVAANTWTLRRFTADALELLCCALYVLGAAHLMPRATSYFSRLGRHTLLPFVLGPALCAPFASTVLPLVVWILTATSAARSRLESLPAAVMSLFDARTASNATAQLMDTMSIGPVALQDLGGRQRWEHRGPFGVDPHAILVPDPHIPQRNAAASPNSGIVSSACSSSMATMASLAPALAVLSIMLLFAVLMLIALASVAGVLSEPDKVLSTLCNTVSIAAQSAFSLYVAACSYVSLFCSTATHILLDVSANIWGDYAGRRLVRHSTGEVLGLQPSDIASDSDLLLGSVSTPQRNIDGVKSRAGWYAGTLVLMLSCIQVFRLAFWSDTTTDGTAFGDSSRIASGSVGSIATVADQIDARADIVHAHRYSRRRGWLLPLQPSARAVDVCVPHWRVDDKCRTQLDWAMSIGIYQHPQRWVSLKLILLSGTHQQQGAPPKDPYAHLSAGMAI